MRCWRRSDERVIDWLCSRLCIYWSQELIGYRYSEKTKCDTTELGQKTTKAILLND